MATAFDPDAYLSQPTKAPAAAAFDPDAYLQSLPAVTVTPETAGQPIGEIPQGRRSYSLAEVPGAAVRNIPSSAKQMVTGLYEAVTSPVQTTKGLWDIAAGATQKLTPAGLRDWVNKFDASPEAAARAIESANAVGGMLADRYGSYDAIKRTLAEDPVGAVADLSTILTGGAAATSRVPGLAKVTAGLERAATVTNPFTAVTAPVQKAMAFKESVLPGKLSQQKELNAVRDATLEAAQREGYMTTPGSSSLTPTGKNIVAERMAGKTHLEQLMSVNNQMVTDKLSRRALGVSETTPLTSNTTKAIRAEEYSKGYAPLERIGKIRADNKFVDDMIAVESKYEGPNRSFPGAVPESVDKLLKTYTQSEFNSKDALQAIRRLREDSKANFRKGENELAHAQTDIANALENQMERAIIDSKIPGGAQMLEKFRLARQRMAISHTIEDAIRKGSGSVDAKKLARDLQSGKYVSGDIETMAEFANVFPRVNVSPSTIGTPGGGTMMGVPAAGVGGMLGGGLGYLAGDAGGMGIGAAMGAYGPQLISAGMRQYLMSPKVQNKLIPTYESTLSRVASDTAARNALLAAQAGAVTNRNNLNR